MKIKGITSERITFDDDSCIWFDHEQDCCETNYADFNYLAEEGDILNYEFNERLCFESVNKSGFRFGDNRRMWFCPCYSEQNGYYTDQIDIYYTKNGNTEQVLSFNCQERTSFYEPY